MEKNGNSLAKIALGINVVLIIAVIFLFVKMPSSSESDVAEGSDSTTIKKPIVDDGQLRIAYFYADSLNSKLLFMKELEGLMAQSQQNAEDKMRQKEREIQKWQEGWQSAGALLPKEQEKYAREAAQKEQEIAMFQQEVQMTLASEQEGYMFTLITRISNASKEYAEANDFDYIVSYQMGQNFYYMSPNFDVTDDIIEIMNKQYSDRTDDAENPEEEAE